MYERGTYNQAMTAGGYGWIGADVTDEAQAAAKVGSKAITTAILMLIGTWIGRGATPTEPLKGGTIGLAAGYFGSLLLQQTDALERIADHTRR
jgi:hypothetical protein